MRLGMQLDVMVAVHERELEEEADFITISVNDVVRLNDGEGRWFRVKDGINENDGVENEEGECEGKNDIEEEGLPEGGEHV